MSEEPQPAKAPALWGHCVRVYEAMAEQAETKTIYEVDRLVWTGYMTKLFVSLGLAVPAYTSVRRELMRMDCIRQMKRGGGSTPSVWVLFEPPSLDKYNEAKAPSIDTASGAPKRRAMEILQQQINELRQRVTALEEAHSQREAS